MRLLRRGIRDGLSVEDAAQRSGYDLATARLIAADDLKSPPPEEAYTLLYDPDAPADASSTKEAAVAKEDEAGEYQRPDAGKAFEIYDKQIKPKLAKMDTLKGDLSRPYDDIKEQAHFPRKVLNFIISLEGEEDAKRDHLLLALSEGLKHRKLFLPRDLVTMANGEAEQDVVGTEAREDDDLLVDEDEDDDASSSELPLAAEPETFTEASEEEVEQQAGRKPRRTARPSTVTRINPPTKPAPEARAH
ncbi:hypothetical protein [Novosphingobium gossypii]|uniref:hypothetical protein n=1 Tax=Novosphingobium gossypii TaxID=1604774 RepID=UPI003D1C7A16